MKIGGLQKLTLIDYPGKIAATVFTVGCNFRCGFCHNSELVNLEAEPPSGLILEEEFFDFLKSRHDKLEGVCITGGEPTLQKDLADFLRKIKNLGFDVKLDTNGTNPEVLEKLIKEGLVDYVAMDVKTVPSNQYPVTSNYETVTNTKVDLDKIQKSVEIIKKSGKEGKIDYEFRTTVLPKFHTKEDLILIGEWLKEVSPKGKAKKYFLQQFRPEKTLDSSLKKEKEYTSEELKGFCKILKPYFDHCGVRD